MFVRQNLSAERQASFLLHENRRKTKVKSKGIKESKRGDVPV
jgi:hypothetical protein